MSRPVVVTADARPDHQLGDIWAYLFGRPYAYPAYEVESEEVEAAMEAAGLEWDEYGQIVDPDGTRAHPNTRWIGRLTTQQAADWAGVKPATWRSYVARGRAPRPDGHFGATPWWSEQTVRQWASGRNRG